jgi:hypothetical protein
VLYERCVVCVVCCVCCDEVQVVQSAGGQDSFVNVDWKRYGALA